MAHQLSEAGASKYIGDKVSNAIEDLGLPPVPFLAVAYFLTTFMFSSLSAHIVAFVGTFLDAGHALGAQPMILVAFIAYFGALGGCMVRESSMQIAIIIILLTLFLTRLAFRCIFFFPFIFILDKLLYR